MLKKKIKELMVLLVGNPIACDFKEVYEFIIDDMSYSYVLTDIIEEEIIIK